MNKAKHFSVTSNTLAICQVLKVSNTDEELKEAISSAIKKFLKNNRMTLEEFAFLVGVSRSQAIRWKQKNNIPHPRHIAKLKMLGVLE